MMRTQTNPLRRRSRRQVQCCTRGLKRRYTLKIRHVPRMEFLLQGSAEQGAGTDAAFCLKSMVICGEIP